MKVCVWGSSELSGNGAAPPPTLSVGSNVAEPDGETKEAVNSHAKEAQGDEEESSTVKHEANEKRRRLSEIRVVKVRMLI